MQEVLWFVAGLGAGSLLTGWGRRMLVAATTAINRVGDAVAAGTPEQGKNVGGLWEEARTQRRRKATDLNSQRRQLRCGII
jgi:hypothetical protein